MTDNALPILFPKIIAETLQKAASLKPPKTPRKELRAEIKLQDEIIEAQQADIEALYAQVFALGEECDQNDDLVATILNNYNSLWQELVDVSVKIESLQKRNELEQETANYWMEIAQKAEEDLRRTILTPEPVQYDFHSQMYPYADSPQFSWTNPIDPYE